MSESSRRAVCEVECEVGAVRFSTWFLAGPRGSGRTTAICEAAKSINATVLAANHSQARLLKRDYGVDSVSIYAPGEGLRGPFLADHLAAEHIVLSLEQTIKDSQKEICRLKSENQRLESRLKQE